ncbi:MAG: hypothetical protein JSU04_06325 [Bdellovibrionales bacterium]|nr:hypothetical protein [Bdellovibrionales bacterium]
MKIEYVEGAKTIKINDREIDLQDKIWSVLEYKNKCIVTLDPDFGRRNVFCFDADGNLLWQIEKAEFFKHGDQGYEGAYIGALEVQGKLMVGSRGRPFYLDINTGKVEFIPGTFEK